MHYLKVAVRNLLRHRVYSLINMLGLAIGMASCILILLCVRDELSYDRYHEKADQIYRAIHEVDRGDGEVTQSGTSPSPMAPALLDDFPEVIHAVRFARGKTVMRHGDRLFYEPLVFADASVFDVFDSPLDATASSDVPFRMKPGFLMRRWSILPEGARDEGAIPMPTYLIDHDFVETLGVELTAGRNFSKDFATDATAAFILNETAATRFGWTPPEAALGRRLIWGHGKSGTVIGVVKGFHVQSLYQRIEPMVFHISPKDFYHISVRICPDHISGTLDFLKNMGQKFMPDRPFEPFFLDDYFDSLHRADERIGRILGSFSLLAIFVACLGLFGLASFAAEQRTKEIGIRKVLGASVPKIFLLLSKEFTKLVIVSNLMAWPIAYFAMKDWLQKFAYRIDLSIEIFVLGGVLALVIALLTVSSQAIKAALANPVDALRYE